MQDDRHPKSYQEANIVRAIQGRHACTEVGGGAIAKRDVITDVACGAGASDAGSLS